MILHLITIYQTGLLIRLLGVIAGFDPVIPEEYIKSDYVYLANNDPKQNIKILRHFQNPGL